MEVVIGVFQNKTISLNFTQNKCRVQGEGLMACANNEQIHNTIMEGFLTSIQSSVMNHDIEEDFTLGMATIRKWANVAETFQPIAPVSVDTARLQRQIEELSAKLESTQMRVVSEPRKTIQFDELEHETSPTTTTEGYRGQPQGVPNFKSNTTGENFARDTRGSGNNCQRSNSMRSTARTPLMTTSNWQSADQRSELPR